MALVTILVVLRRLSSSWWPVLKIPARLLAALFGVFVLLFIVMNHPLLLGVEH